MNSENPAQASHALNIALVTEEAAGIRLLRSLSASPHNICYVFCSAASESMNGISVWTIANDLGLNTVPVEQLKQPTTPQKLKDANIDLIISVRSPAILNDKIIACPRIGAFNLHTGPLPAYAGRNVISWAIFNGENSHGVTLHELTAEIDGGDIIYQSLFPIEQNDTALDVTGRCIKEGIILVNKLINLAALSPTQLPRKQQDSRLRHYYDKSTPNQGNIDWNWDADKIDRFVRACNFYPLPTPWGHPKAVIGNQPIQVLSVQKTSQKTEESPGSLKVTSEKKILVACKDGWIHIDEVITDEGAQEAFQALTAE